MADEEKKKVDDVNEENFFGDVLDVPEEEDVETQPEDQGDDDTKGDTEDEKKERPQKNKDAEEARKRREAEAKAKAQEKAEQARKEKEAKEKEEAEKKKSAKEKQSETLGQQLEDFKNEYPDVDLKALDKDKSFKRFINGKLLGKQDFKELYKDYLELRADMTGQSEDEVQENYRIKAQASTGSTQSKAESTPNDVYSEKEYNDIVSRIPLMTDEEAEAVMEKLDRSTEFYSKKK